jgi:hypothetical protein
MGASQIPKDVADAIRKCWPVGIVEEFATDESYFHQIQSRLGWDLRKIRGASLLWQTEEEESGSGWVHDWEDEEPPPSNQWQSVTVQVAVRSQSGGEPQAQLSKDADGDAWGRGGASACFRCGWFPE